MVLAKLVNVKLKKYYLQKANRQTFACSQLTVKTLEEDKKYVQSYKKNKNINGLLFPLTSPENLQFSDEFRENRGAIILSNSLNIKSEIVGRSLTELVLHVNCVRVYLSEGRYEGRYEERYEGRFEGRYEGRYGRFAA